MAACQWLYADLALVVVMGIWQPWLWIFMGMAV
jgi:hypothetical protein